MENPLTKRVLLLGLHIQRWAGEVSDRRALSAVAKTLRSDTRHDRYVKSLFVTDPLLPLRTASTRIRKHFYKHTLPWLPQDNGRIIPGENFHEFNKEYKQLKGLYEGEVEQFLLDYPDHMEAAKASKGDLFDAADYPPVDQIRNRFSVQLVVLPFPDTSDIRLDIPAEIFEESMSEVTDTIVADIYMRLEQTLEVLYTAVTERKRIKSAAYTNVADVCTLAHKLGDALPTDTQVMLDNVRTMLEQHPLPKIRTSDQVKADTASVVLVLLRNLRNAQIRS